MKIQGQKYETMKNAMKAVVEYFGGAQQVATTCMPVGSKITPIKMLWRLWFIAARNLQHGDNHPAFQTGQWVRIIPQDPTFDEYSDGANDDHIETALKAIGRELGLI